MRNKIIIFLSLIFLFAFGLRFWQIGQYPAGLNADEASYGYNAYSLVLTGKDEHGESWPIHLKSFADYKPAGTAYIVLPFVKLFGLSVKTIRFPSVLAGAASVLLVFLLVRELFSSSRLALLTSFFLAISPWHLHFSRGAWETNLGTTFMLLGAWLFFKGLKNAKYFPLSIINFAFSMYTYHAPRVVIPLLGFFLLVFCRKKLFKYSKWLIVAALIGAILITPLLLSFLGPAGLARFSGLSIFADIGPLWWVNRARGEHANPFSISAFALHNRLVAYSFEFLQNYLNHFDGVFLFILGDKVKRSNPPDMGQMYLFDLIFLIFGFYFLFRKRPKNWQIPLAWLFLAPIPAALTFQTPSALRAHKMIIPLIIISAYGCYNLILFLRKRLPKLLYCNIAILLIAIFIFWNTAYYLHQYYLHYPKAYPEAWEYGYQELVDYLWPIRNDFSKVYVTEQYDQPYIIFLFYLKYPPEKFQQEVKLTPRDKFGFSTVREFDNFHFEYVDWEGLKTKSNALVCGTDEEIPDETENVNIIKEIYFLNGEPAFQCAKI
jgi:4-amino-4-deoxy-L-arabinose transferase-like glycosyltransferase